jgi:hypothetical protein
MRSRGDAQCERRDMEQSQVLIELTLQAEKLSLRLSVAIAMYSNVLRHSLRKLPDANDQA